MKLIDVIDLQICELRIISQLLGRQCISVFACHDETMVFDEEAPSRIADLTYFES